LLTAWTRERAFALVSVASAIAFIFPFKLAAGQGHGAGAASGRMIFSALLFTPWDSRGVGLTFIGQMQADWLTEQAADLSLYLFFDERSGVVCQQMQVS
jgi:hypothetical protein